MHPSPPATSPFKSTATPSPAFSDQKLPCESNFDPREREGESLSVFLLVNKAPGFVVADTRVDATVEDWFGKGVLRASVFTDFLGSNLKRKEKIPIKNFPIILFERILFCVKRKKKKRGKGRVVKISRANCHASRTHASWATKSVVTSYTVDNGIGASYHGSLYSN